MRFSREAARSLLLAAQGLADPPEPPATKGDVLESVRKMGVLQIDSIAVVARSPYLVLWSRLGAYEPSWLDELLAEGALEHLFAAGELMISRRDPNFHRVYDLRERVLGRALPGWEDGLAPTQEEARRALALKAVRSLGVAVARWGPDYFRTPQKGVSALLEELADEGELVRAGIEGLDEPAYVHPGNAEQAEKILSGGLQSSVSTLLSPFDPIVWDRARALELFD